MRKLVFYLSVALIIFYTPITIAQSPTPPTPEDYFVNPDVYVEELPALLISRPELTFETPLGHLRTNFLDNLQRLFLQYNEDPFQYFSVPPEWEFGMEGTIEVFPFPDGTQVLYCNHKVRSEAPYRITGVGIIIEPLTGNVRRVETCYITPNANGYVYSEELVSPDGANMVVISHTKEVASEDCPTEEYIREFGYPSQIYANQTLIGCINAPGIEGRGWVDNHKLTLRTFDPKSSSLPVEYWYQLDTTEQTLTPLGLTIEFEDTLFYTHISSFLLDDGQTLVRWMIDEMGETDRHPAGVFPQTCEVESLNLATLETTVFGQDNLASCLFNPEITLSDAKDFLLYVHTTPNPDPAKLDYSTSTLKRINLQTNTERTLSVSGRVIHIESISPDGKRALLVVDSDDAARNNPYEDGIAYVDPHWIVYDLEADTALYTSPDQSSSYYGYLRQTTLGLKAFTWTDDGWQGVFNGGNSRFPLSVMRWQAGELTEIPLEGLPERGLGENYYISPSPDNAYFLATMGSQKNNYLIEAVTGEVVELTVAEESLDIDDLFISERWREDGDIEILFRSTNNLLSLARWRIDPSKAFGK